MTPQRKGTVPEPQLQAMLAARDNATTAQDAYELAVADALKAGGSVREVAKAAGLSPATVQKWGRAHGWPSEGQREQWAAEKAPRDEFTARMKAARAVLDDLD